MTAKAKAKGSKQIAAKARQVLEFAESIASRVADSMELYLALFGAHGFATRLFPTNAEIDVLFSSPEFKRINALLDELPRSADPELAAELASANGAISVRLPRSVHAALLAEAKAEGVSLNQLCVAKLVVQLRAVV
jgi:hypothetical protein